MNEAGERTPARGEEVMDLRPFWAVVGAWPAALLPAGSGLAGWCAAASLAMVVLGLYFLMRGRGLIAWSYHLWGPVFAAAGGAALVASTLALAQPSRSGEEHVAALVGEDSVVRAEITLTRDSTVRGIAPPDSGFGSDEELRADTGPEWPYALSGTTAWQQRAAGELTRVKHGGTWLSVSVPVYLSMPIESDLTERPTAWRAGTRVAGLVQLELAEPGMNHDYWARGAAAATVIAPDRAAWVHQLRDRFTAASKVLPDPGRALLPGMVMGDRTGQSERLDDAMKVTGLAHLTAVSGANCALIMGSVLWVLRLVRVPRLVAAAGSLMALAGFVVLVGPDASVVRAAVMGSIAALAVFAGRGRQAFAALCLCIVVLLACVPDFATDVAFQLSVLATAGIVLLGRPVASLLDRLLPAWLAPTWLTQGIAISVAAQLFCQPVLILLEPRLASYAVLANLLVAPVVPLITVAGTAGLVAAVLPSYAILPLIWLSGMPAHWVGSLALTVSQWPGASVPWPEGALGSSLAAALALVCAAGTWFVGQAIAGSKQGVGRPRQTARHITGACASFAALAAVMGGTLAPATRYLEPTMPADIAMCDVGQGDALLIRTGEHRAIGVDVGPDAEAYTRCLERLGVHELEVLFISHLHADHVGALAQIAGQVPIGTIYYSTSLPVDDSARGVPDFLRTAASETKIVRRASAGDVGQHDVARDAGGEVASLHWRVLWPEAASIPVEENDASLVIGFELHTSNGSLNMLATGDIEETAMKQLLASHPHLSTHVLKVAHHGARNGGLDTVTATEPEVALIGVGANNSYGHPAPEIVRSYTDHGVSVGRTDQHGLLVIDVGPDGRAVLRALGANDREE